MMQYANTTNSYGNTWVASAYEILYHSHHINTMYWVGHFFCLSLTARQHIKSVDMIGILLVCNYGIEFCQQLSQQNVGVAIDIFIILIVSCTNLIVAPGNLNTIPSVGMQVYNVL